MKNSIEYIESGILEMYVLGDTTKEENIEVERMAASDPLIRKELESIRAAIEEYALAHAIEPDPVIKPLLLAKIDYTDRMEKGEKTPAPPMLNKDSKAEDFTFWLERPDMVMPAEADQVFVKIIGYTPEAVTAIVWLKDMAPAETHTNELERFFILEGTCNITVEDEVHSLNPGDFFAIPLHKNHMVKVTSEIPCKVILQRLAA